MGFRAPGILQVLLRWGGLGCGAVLGGVWHRPRRDGWDLGSGIWDSAPGSVLPAHPSAATLTSFQGFCFFPTLQDDKEKGGICYRKPEPLEGAGEQREGLGGDVGRDLWRVTAGWGSRGDPAVPKPLLQSLPTPQLHYPTGHPNSLLCSPSLPRAPTPCLESPWSALGTSVAPQCHLHPSCPLFPPAEPPAVPQMGSKSGSGKGNHARGAEEEHPGAVEGGSTIRAGDRPVPTPRTPSQTLGGRPRSPVLPAGPVATVTAVPVATDSPGGSLGTTPSPHPFLWDGSEPPLPSVPHLPGGPAIGRREGGPGEPRTAARGSVSPQEGTKTWPRGT